MEPFVGQIQAFGFSFAPRGWALCDGQLLSVSTNDALFSLLGTIYGGDGRNTFGLPDLRGRVPMHWGSGPGLSTYRIGEKGGLEEVSLTLNQLPSHNHTFNVVAEAPSGATKPSGAVLANPSTETYSSHATPDAVLKSSAVGQNGGSLPHKNIQPSLAISWCIALVGIYPSRS